MPIPHVGKVITECWVEAEQALRNHIKSNLGDRDEESVTELFHEKLAIELNRASISGCVATAYQKDLEQTFWQINSESLSDLAHGLIATVSFHDRKTEARTGGDLGIVVVRPDVHQGWGTLTLDQDYRRGLLCQAKMFRRNSRWGPISAKQKNLLSKSLSYLSLLLYKYLDQKGERRALAPFQWQLAHDKTVEQMCEWLASDQFPELQSSEQILGKLLADEIGTDVKEFIERDIAPPELRPALVIKIGWKDGGPPRTVQVQERFRTQMQEARLRH
jgi:hypothetical protein